MTKTQIVILTLLAVILCAILTGTAGVLYFYRAAFTAPSLSPPAALVSTPTPTPTATRRPTAVLPPAQDTPAPTPVPTYAVSPEQINERKIREITEFVEQWRELSLPSPLPLEFLTRTQLRDEWAADSYERETIEAIQTQQAFYRAMGLIEPDIDLLAVALEAQSAGIMGYYTPDEKIMVIIAESVNMFAEEEMTFAHEYTHALQDYHFDLSSFFDSETSADAQLAARSLPEGDARLVQDLFTMENISSDQLDYTVYRYLFQENFQQEGVSPALGIFTYFPYSAGEYFAIYLFIEGNYSWDKVNAAYRHPPLSTEQVMHPEKYLADEQPVLIHLPDLMPVLGTDWRELDRNVLGEAGFLVWLIDQTDDQIAIDGAAGWGGDAYSLWVDGENRPLLVELSQWDSQAEAVEFTHAFTQYMTTRTGDQPATADDSTAVWSTAAGPTLLSRIDNRALIIVAPDTNTLAEVHRQFDGF
jgi:hypothetical protein